MPTLPAPSRLVYGVKFPSRETFPEGVPYRAPLKRNSPVWLRLLFELPTEEVIKAELLCYRWLYRFDQRSASLVFLDRGILSFAFHQVLSSGAVPLDVGESLEFHVVVLMVPLQYEMPTMT